MPRCALLRLRPGDAISHYDLALRSLTISQVEAMALGAIEARRAAPDDAPGHSAGRRLGDAVKAALEASERGADGDAN